MLYQYQYVRTYIPARVLDRQVVLYALKYNNITYYQLFLCGYIAAKAMWDHFMLLMVCIAFGPLCLCSLVVQFKSQNSIHVNIPHKNM